MTRPTDQTSDATLPARSTSARSTSARSTSARPTSALYHNPGCSKSRQALELLTQRGIEPTIIAYLELPPSEDALKALLSMLDLPARDLLRTSQAEYSELGLADPALGPDQLIAAMAAHPRLIQRPIFIHGGGAVIGRPPQRVLELLD